MTKVECGSESALSLRSLHHDLLAFLDVEALRGLHHLLTLQVVELCGLLLDADASDAGKTFGSVNGELGGHVCILACEFRECVGSHHAVNLFSLLLEEGKLTGFKHGVVSTLNQLGAGSGHEAVGGLFGTSDRLRRDALNGLRPGLYIVDGRKVVVK